MATERPAVDVPSHVLDYIAGHETLTLATASSTGVPRATTLMYAEDGPILYVWTQPESTVARHVDENPVVSFTVDELAGDWREAKGVQGTGEAQVLLSPADVAHAVELFAAKFPAVSSETPANVSFFRIVPSELQFIEGTAAGGDEQALGLEFRREIVYNVFRDLPPKEVATIASRLQTVQVEPGEVIVRQGGPADKFFIIVDGEVDVVREDGDEERQLNVMRSGEFFGEMAILRDAPRTATVRATRATTLLAMDRDTFRALVAQSLGTTENFHRIVNERLYRLVAEGPS